MEDRWIYDLTFNWTFVQNCKKANTFAYCIIGKQVSLLRTLLLRKDYFSFCVVMSCYLVAIQPKLL